MLNILCLLAGIEIGAILAFMIADRFIYEPQRKAIKEFEDMLIRSLEQTDRALKLVNTTSMPVISPIQLKK